MFFKVHIETASHAIFGGHPPNFPVKSDVEKNNNWNQCSLNYDLLKKPNRRCNFAIQSKVYISIGSNFRLEYLLFFSHKTLLLQKGFSWIKIPSSWKPMLSSWGSAIPFGKISKTKTALSKSLHCRLMIRKYEYDLHIFFFQNLYRARGGQNDETICTS